MLFIILFFLSFLCDIIIFFAKKHNIEDINAWKKEMEYIWHRTKEQY